MLGEAAIAMWWNIAPQMQAEFEDWHSHEHMPERLAIPGFLRGTRWIARSGEPSYFVLYEAEDLATITAGPYLERLNDPTPWSRKMMPHHRNMARSLCRVRATFGAGVAQLLATLRYAPAGREIIAMDVMRGLPRRAGLTGVHRLESQALPAAQTVEQEIRGADARADGVLLIGGYDEGAVGAAAEEIVPAGSTLGFYRLAYCLTSQDRA